MGNRGKWALGPLPASLGIEERSDQPGIYPRLVDNLSAFLYTVNTLKTAYCSRRRGFSTVTHDFGEIGNKHSLFVLARPSESTGSVRKIFFAGRVIYGK
jgi:hypothetical protein